MPRTIFYSFKIHGNLFPEHNLILNCQNLPYREIKLKIINFLSNQGYLVREIIRPEIYKHIVSFNFLQNFNEGDIHLIFKPMEFIRPLKNAYNIWVKIEPLKSWNGPPCHPFFEFSRMFSLIEEIWNFFPDNQLAYLANSNSPNIINIFDDKGFSNVSFGVILKRVKLILGE